MKIRGIILLLLFLVSCVPETGSGAFGPPEIVVAEAVPGIDGVHLSCTLSDPRAERCGFAYALSGQDFTTVECRLEGTSFRLDLGGLVPGVNYEWYAFARAGESTVRSETARFTLPELPAEERAEIPDPVFKHYLTDHFDLDGDGEISLTEAGLVRKIAVRTDDITSLEGIRYFTNLDTLVCRGVDPDFDINGYEGRPGLLKSLDLSENKRLRHLECDGNLLQELILPDSDRLEYLRCARNLLSELDLTPLPNLGSLQASDNNISALDFSQSTRIRSIEIGGNLIKSIDVSSCPWLFCLNIGGLEIKDIDLSGNPNLDWLGVYDTKITSLDLRANTKLRFLDCFETDISSLDLTPCGQLYELKCWNCRMETVDVSMLPNLAILECSPMASLKSLYVSEDQKIEGITENRSDANVPASTEIIVRYKNAPDGKILFEDEAFKDWLLNRFDADRDGEISLEEASEVIQIDITSNKLNITSLQGIEFMPNLEYLRCSGTWVDTDVVDSPYYYISKHYHFDIPGPIGTLKKVDVSHNPKLRVLYLRNNSGIGETGTGTIDLSHNPLLEEVNLTMCYIRYPDVTQCPRLRILGLSHGRGTLPDLTQNPELVEVHLDFNQSGTRQPVDVSRNPLLELLDVRGTASGLSDLSLNPKLRKLQISYCEITEPDLSKCPNLEVLECHHNGITRIDLSPLNHLKALNVSSNLLETLDVSRNPELSDLDCSPMNGSDGKNVLKTLWIAPGQSIPGVTSGRSPDYIPDETEIKTR